MNKCGDCEFFGDYDKIIVGPWEPVPGTNGRQYRTPYLATHSIYIQFFHQLQVTHHLQATTDRNEDPCLCGSAGLSTLRAEDLDEAEILPRLRPKAR